MDQKIVFSKKNKFVCFSIAFLTKKNPNHKYKKNVDVFI